MINTNNRFLPNQKNVRAKFNKKANRIKKINKTLNKRGGIKL